MVSQKMKRQFMCLWLTPLLVTAFYVSWQNASVASQSTQPECIEQATQNGEIVTSKSLDVDQNGELDEVVLYKHDRLYILLALNPSSVNCRIVLDEYLTHFALALEPQTIEVQDIKLIELTGDDRPELYIWVDKEGGGRFVSAAVHTIYTSSDGNWQKGLHLEQCLAFNSFKFQDTTIENIKDIYRDADGVCDSPFSIDRNYDILRWNGSKFETIESGTISIWSMSPPVWYPICVAAIIGLILLLTPVAISVRKRRPFD